MSWSLGFDARYNRFIGYGVPAYCDHPDCDKKIDRGLSYVCGGQPYGGDHGCGLYFCEDHLLTCVSEDDEEVPSQLCVKCMHNFEGHDQEGFEFQEHFPLKPEHPQWIEHLLTDASWQQWRAENPGEVKRLKAPTDGKTV